jgi:hypothetical protein
VTERTRDFAPGSARTNDGGRDGRAARRDRAQEGDGWRLRRRRCDRTFRPRPASTLSRSTRSTSTKIGALDSVADVARDVPPECAAAARAINLTVRHLQAVVRELMLIIRSHGLPLTVLTAAGRDTTWMEMLVLAKAREAAAAPPARV